jgi:hypothetical protein
MTFKITNTTPGTKYVRRDGEVVEYEWYDDAANHCIGGWLYENDGSFCGEPSPYDHDIIAEYTEPQEDDVTDKPKTKDHPKTFGEMTDAEQGALLLAHHRGQRIEAFYGGRWWCGVKDPFFKNMRAYRIGPPEPKRETVVWYGPPGWGVLDDES